MSTASRNFVITGTSGTGKTALVDCLRSQGLHVFEEPTRLLLREQMAVDGPALPAKDPKRFIDGMLDYCLRCLDDASRAEGPCFFDRGLPDLVAYAVRFGVDPEPYVRAAQEHRYHPTVFVLPPWQQIFVADEFRRMTFEQYAGFHEQIVTAYVDAGYELLEVPRVPVELRAAFVLGAVGESDE